VFFVPHLAVAIVPVVGSVITVNSRHALGLLHI
jgi:hypothetical protein